MALTDWIVEKLEPALERMARKRNELKDVQPSRERTRDDVLHDCETIRLSVIHVSNGTLLRMDTRRPDDNFVVEGTRHAPNIVIIKDDEKIQDAVVRMLAIAKLEML